jgi:hypothetical protein
MYWLYVLFAQGWLGAVLHLLGWLALGVALLRRLAAPAGRAPIVLLLALMVLFHVYSLADWPATIAGVLMLWLVPLGLACLAWDAALRETRDKAG